MPPAYTTPTAVALAWLLQRSPNILLVPGTRSAAHLHENIAGAALTLSAVYLVDRHDFDESQVVIHPSRVQAVRLGLGARRRPA